MQALLILLLSIGVAISYGVVHDQVTIRVCPEYFTIGHPRLIESQSLTELAAFWGVAATWWIGVLLGIPLAWVARFGRKTPPLPLRRVAGPVFALVPLMSMSALAAGWYGSMSALHGTIELAEPMASMIDSSRHVPFLAATWAHTASYATGIVGGMAVIVIAAVRRRFQARRSTMGQEEDNSHPDDHRHDQE